MPIGMLYIEVSYLIRLLTPEDGTGLIWIELWVGVYWEKYVFFKARMAILNPRLASGQCFDPTQVHILMGKYHHIVNSMGTSRLVVYYHTLGAQQNIRPPELHGQAPSSNQ
jgi:hypothetical protein